MDAKCINEQTNTENGEREGNNKVALFVCYRITCRTVQTIPFINS